MIYTYDLSISLYELSDSLLKHNVAVVNVKQTEMI